MVFQRTSVLRAFVFCSLNYFRNKLSMYTKVFLFLRESVKRKKDQLNFEQMAPFVLLGIFFQYEAPNYLRAKEQKIPFKWLPFFYLFFFERKQNKYS